MHRTRKSQTKPARRSRLRSTARLVSLALFAMVGSVPTAQADPIEVLLLGDTSFGENYHDRLASEGREPVLRTRGYGYMIANFAPILAEADFAIANLETPITDRFPSPFAGEKTYIHYADIEHTPEQLARHGIDVVSLANNHAFDFGAAGLEQTEDLLRAHGIAPCGAGANIAAARAPVVHSFDTDARTVTIAILCMFERRDSYAETYAFYAGQDRPGTFGLDPSAVAQIIERLRGQHEDLFVIAFPHWGRNYRRATGAQREQARALVAAGVDLVVGHGAHVFQEVEIVDGTPVVFGLGNFVFGSPGRYAKERAHPYSLIGALHLSPAGSARRAFSLRLYPVFSDNRQTAYQPRFVSDPEFLEVIELLTSPPAAPRFFTGRDARGWYLEPEIP